MCSICRDIVSKISLSDNTREYLFTYRRRRFPQLRYALLTFRQCMLKAPSMLLDDNIRFEDALGRLHSLQYSHFCHWEVREQDSKCPARYPWQLCRLTLSLGLRSPT